MAGGTKTTQTTAMGRPDAAFVNQGRTAVNNLTRYQAASPDSRVAGSNDLIRNSLGMLPGAAAAGQGTLAQGINTVNAAAGYQPQMLEAAQAAAAQGVSGDQIQQFLAMSGGNGSVSARDVTAMDAAAKMGQYRDPYEDQVVNAVADDIETARQRAITGNKAAATAAASFGGTRHGITEALTNKAALSQLAQTTAGLRSQGFRTAAELGAADANRNLQGQVSNQGADISAGSANLNAGLSRFGTLANIGVNNAQMANQVGMFNAGQTNQIGVQNQQAGLTANQQRLGAGQALGSLGTAQQGMSLAGVDAMLRGGSYQRGMEQERYDAAQQERLLAHNDQYAQLNARVPFMTPTSQTTTTQQKGSFLGTVAGLAGTIAGIPGVSGAVSGLLGGGGGAAGLANAATSIAPRMTLPTTTFGSQVPGIRNFATSPLPTMPGY